MEITLGILRLGDFIEIRSYVCLTGRGIDLVEYFVGLLQHYHYVTQPERSCEESVSNSA